MCRKRYSLTGTICARGTFRDIGTGQAAHTISEIIGQQEASRGLCLAHRRVLFLTSMQDVKATASAAISESQLKELRRAAEAASTKAYCPYSHFPVGSAVLTDTGAIFAGCNIENASYGLTICAERNAVFHAVAAGFSRIVAVVIFTPTPAPSAPCGACRQVLNEFAATAVVCCYCNAEQVLRSSMPELLSFGFGPNNLV
jgi:cytidine deaminase